MKEDDPILEVRKLVRTYQLPRTSLRRPRDEVQALGGISLQIKRGETFGIVGESGSGKSTLARLMLALDRPQSGEVRFEGTNIFEASGHDLRRFRREVQIVFQDPMGSLDPRMRIKKIILEPLRSLGYQGDAKARLGELLQAVGLTPGSAGRYPHEFSGGQRQRIAIARALAPKPRVLVADEPVSALDVSVRAQILNLLDDLKEQYDFTLVLISHDLSVVQHMCDHIAIMYRGEIVETGSTEDTFDQPRHPYTRALLEAVPTLEGRLPEAPQFVDGL